MNGGGPRIEIIKPFEEGFEVMKKILFQPFDAKKWFVIGFAAWLANLGSGSNYNLNPRGNDWKDFPGARDLRETIGQIPHSTLILGIVAFIALILVLIFLFAWLRARGRFMFVDCVVKNQGAIAQPWREFRPQGNSYFLFTVLVGVIVTIILSATALPFLMPIIRRGARPDLHDIYLIFMIAVWAAGLAVLVIAWSLISHFMIAIMYRRRCLAGEGFRAALFLIRNYPGEITLYCLFWIAVTIGAGMASCLVILSTCCIALLPYIGTVLMLPIFVVLRAFGLCFIRQFGPDYDVWAGNVEPPPIVPPTPPPLQT